MGDIFMSSSVFFRVGRTYVFVRVLPCCSVALKADGSRRVDVDQVDEPPRRALFLPASTIAKVLLTLFALWALYKLGTVIALVLIAVVLAIALEPAVEWLERRRVPRWVGATVAVSTVVGCLVVFIVLCGCRSPRKAVRWRNG